MSQETVVDDTLVDEQPPPSTLLPIADPEDEVALLPQDNEKGKDIVKWIEVAVGTETQMVPFVHNTITRKVHCGAITMKLKRGQNGQVYVNCLSGCFYNDRQCEDSCTCFCHALSRWYRSHS